MNLKFFKMCIRDSGNIVEQGSHEKSLELNGRYREMWDVYTESKEIEVI